MRRLGLGLLLVGWAGFLWPTDAWGQSPTGCCKTTIGNCYPRVPSDCPAPYSFLPFTGSQTACSQISQCNQPLTPPFAGCCEPRQVSQQCTDNNTDSVCPPPNILHPGQACSAVTACQGRTASTPALPPLAPAAPDTSQQPALTFEPEVPFGTWGGSTIRVSADTVGEYIRAVFVFFIWSVGVLAVVMVTYGGIKWVAAAGNPGRINDAREVINSALIGLIIALTSFVILNLVDRRFTTFQGLTLSTVKSEPLVFDNVVGLHGEGSQAKGCNTKSGKPIAPESTCFFQGHSFVWPVADATRQITSTVGLRKVEGASSASTCHSGTDFSTDRKVGKIIRAAHAGVVEYAGKVANEFAVFIRGDGFYTRYIHLSSMIAENGLRVKPGEFIGTSGGDPKVAGNWSSAPHSHIELYSSSGELHDLAPCVR